VQPIENSARILEDYLGNALKHGRNLWQANGKTMIMESSRKIFKANHALEPKTAPNINHPRHVVRLQPLLFQDGVASEAVESIVNLSLRYVPGERAIREFVESIPSA
jgi:hypothetical protein